MEGGGERHPGEPPRTLGQLVPKLGKQKTPARKNTTQAHKVRTDREWGLSQNYHLCLDSSEFGIEGCVDIIVELSK